MYIFKKEFVTWYDKHLGRIYKMTKIDLGTYILPVTQNQFSWKEPHLVMLGHIEPIREDVRENSLLHTFVMPHCQSLIVICLQYQYVTKLTRNESEFEKFNQILIRNCVKRPIVLDGVN